MFQARRAALRSEAPAGHRLPRFKGRHPTRVRGRNVEAPVTRSLSVFVAACAAALLAGCPQPPPPACEAGCGDGGNPPSDASVVTQPDAGSSDDAGASDAGAEDAGPEDAGRPDAGPLDGGGADGGGPGDGGATDGGGGWPALTDPGNWQVGPPAPCGVKPTLGTCGELSSFEVSGCNSASLGQVIPEGIWTTHVVYDRDAGDAFTGMLTLTRDGGPEYSNGRAITLKQMDSTHFFLSAHPDGGAYRSYVGCQATGPSAVTGCYAQCQNGQQVLAGAFEAYRVARIPGEGVSKNLTFVSESYFSPDVVPVDLYVTKQHAYVVALGGGLKVYNVSNPAAPVLTKTVFQGNDNYWNGVWAKGDALYVASARSGVITFDITNPGQPVLLGAQPTPPVNVHTVFVRGDLMLGISPGPTGEVLIYDVTSEKNPLLLSRFVAPGANPALDNWPHDAFIFEDRLYVNHWALGYVVADLTKPSNVKQLGSYRYPTATSHANAVGRFAGRLVAFEGGEDWGAHLRVLDVTDPTKITLIGAFQTRPSASIHNMVLIGTRLYVAYYSDGVRVLDVADPSHPVQVGYYNTWNETDPERGLSFYEGAIGMRVPGDGYVYTVDSSRGLIILKEP